MRGWSLYLGFIILAVFLVLFRPSSPFDYSIVEVTIPTGASTRTVENILVENGVLPHFSIFRPLLRLSGLQRQIKAGVYSLSPADPLPSVVAKLLAGETVPPKEIKVTFPEGSSIYKMGIILKESGFNNWRKFQGLVHEGITAELRQKYWGIFKYIPSESLEAYLFPDTYHFYLDASAESAAEIMLKRFNKMIMPFWDENKNNTKFTLHEILTLASIIEKEARHPSERPIIASVFYNRLNKGMPLAADPTIKYALERPSKIVYLNQLDVKSPYNTYKRKGLPPGPICNPGLDSFKAAIYPARTNYYFFVAKKDGSHIFSRTWSEHQKARGINPYLHRS